MEKDQMFFVAYMGMNYKLSQSQLEIVQNKRIEKFVSNFSMNAKNICMRHALFISIDVYVCCFGSIVSRRKNERLFHIESVSVYFLQFVFFIIWKCVQCTYSHAKVLKSINLSKQIKNASIFIWYIDGDVYGE